MSDYLPPPADVHLPFFAYGFLRPHEIAYPRISAFVRGQPIHATVKGELRLRDGLLLLDLGGQWPITGYLVEFDESQAAEAYDAIGKLEPKKLYRWSTARVSASGGEKLANVLVGKRPQTGSERWHGGDWSSKNHPLFKEALEEVSAIAATDPRSIGSPDLRQFFREQMAYLLLWTAIERYASLRWGFGGGALERVKRLANEPSFAKALRREVSEERVVRRSDKPECRETLTRDDPTKSIEYYYQVRSNMVHRGKADGRDIDIVGKSLRELLAIFKHVLSATLRSVSDA